MNRREFVQTAAAGVALPLLGSATEQQKVIERPFKQIEPLVKTGDAIIWSGVGKGLVQRIFVKGIKNRCGPYTHVSTALWITVAGRRWLHVAETMMNGLVLDSLERRLSEGEKEGWTHCWWLPMSDARRARLSVPDMVDYLMDRVNIGTRYDVKQAVAASTDRKDNLPNDERLFCSEWHMAALLRGGAVSNCNYSEAVPLDVVRFKLHKPTVYDIWRHSDPKWGRIPLENDLNQVEPDNWQGYE